MVFWFFVFFFLNNNKKFVIGYLILEYDERNVNIYICIYIFRFYVKKNGIVCIKGIIFLILNICGMLFVNDVNFI